MILSGVRVLKNALVLYDSKENPSIAVCTTFFPQFLQLFPILPYTIYTMHKTETSSWP